MNPNLRTPFVEEFSGSFEHQFAGESSIRVTLVRKSSRDYAPYYFSAYIPAWVGQLTVPTRVTVIGPSGQAETYNVFDIPESLTGQSDTLYDNIPNSDFHYTTAEFAFSSPAGRRFFVQVSGDHQWRDELRTADALRSPLSADPIGVGFFLNPNPSVPNRQRTTTYQLQALGRYVFPRPRLRWTDIAHELGYHDQMHMVHDFQQLSGSTPSDVAPRLDMFVTSEIEGTR